MSHHFRILDTESTGPSSTPPDVACEMASVDFDYDQASGQGQFLAPKSELCSIGAIKMPPDAQGIHHISNEMLSDARDFVHVFKSIIAPFPFPDRIVFVAHNSEYEFGQVRDPGAKLLRDYVPTEVPIICTYKGALRIWPDFPNHKNQTLRYALGYDIPDKLRGGLPHRALPDAIVTAYNLRELLKHATPDELIQWTKEPRMLPTCPIGKKQGWAGKKWHEVDPKDGGFLRWMLDQPDMEADLKWLAKKELDRRENVRNTEGRRVYMDALPAVIRMAKTVFDLREWFKGEAATRVSLGILDGTAEYAEIVRLCNAHKATLPQAPALPAPDPATVPAGLDPPAPDLQEDEADLTTDPSELTDDDLTRAAA